MSLQPMEKIMVREVVALQPVEVHGRAVIHLQPKVDSRLERLIA